MYFGVDKFLQTARAESGQLQKERQEEQRRPRCCSGACTKSEAEAEAARKQVEEDEAA